MTTAPYDTIIIGAGVAGASAAYFLSQKGQRVLVLDKSGIASGGSGAAGAFVSPKIGKGSLLQKLTNEAFAFAKDFYLSFAPEYFHQSGVIRIPKDHEDAKKFAEYESFNTNSYENIDKEKLQALGIKTEYESFLFSEAGVCEAKELCTFLLKDIEVVEYGVKEIIQEDGFWSVGTYRAENIVLATGFESGLADLCYMGIRGTWGTRGDFSSALDLHVSMHQSMSVSANIGGIIKLGATHEKEVKERIPCDKEQALSLKEKASLLIETSDLELKEVFCGMRAGSKDYFPLVGKVIDVDFMFENYPAIVRGEKPKLKHIDKLFILNGLGGRGFVFAPLMAEWLSQCIVENKEMDSRVNPDRLFLKWCRKLNKNH